DAELLRLVLTEQLNVIRYAVYRTAAKLLALQKLCCLHLVSVSTILTVFNSSAVDWESELNVRQVYQLLRKVHGMASREQPMPHVDGELASELTLNLLLAICDSERSGKVSPRSMWNALLLLSTGQLTHKYRGGVVCLCFARILPHCNAIGIPCNNIYASQLLALLGEGCAFGTAEMAVTSLFHAVSYHSDIPSITESQFLGWCLSEPQLFLWLPAMYRMMKAAGSIHEAKCNICKTCPIVGLRFRCLRCWNLDLCQNCFLTGRDTGWHAPSHPVIESCTS
uniref:ZZ-type domain-containing protein n=1 Tax=Petromyzon marinus TaxID=7757 RepID=S4RZA8_PETMA